MKLEIINAKSSPLKDDEVRAIVEIEQHPEVRKWLVDYGDEDFEKELNEYRRFFSDLQTNNKVEVLIAKLEGRVVGFLALWCIDRDPERMASIGISVHPDYWGRGIATRLIKESIELADKKGIKKLIIETLEENSVMKHVAEKLGFKLETVRKTKIFKDGKYHNEDIYLLQL